MQIKDLYALKGIIDNCDKAYFEIENRKICLKDLERSSYDLNACEGYLFNIGELANALSGEFKNKYNSQPWQDIIDMRNIFAHDYLRVSARIVWKTITNNIPSLKELCEEAIAMEFTDEQIEKYISERKAKLARIKLDENKFLENE